MVPYHRQAIAGSSNRFGPQSPILTNNGSAYRSDLGNCKQMLHGTAYSQLRCHSDIESNTTDAHFDCPTYEEIVQGAGGWSRTRNRPNCVFAPHKSWPPQWLCSFPHSCICLPHAVSKRKMKQMIVHHDHRVRLCRMRLSTSF